MKRVIYRAVLIVISLVGITNIVDSIIASNTADASTSGLTMSATINPSSTITINSNSVTLDITPSASGTLKSSDALTVSAYTNTNYDCNVTMTASSSSLVSGANSIPSLATGTTYTDATFTNDSWGYKIGTNGEYKSVLAGEGANAIKTISSMTGGTANTTDIYFAAKFTPATKPGTYTNTVTFASTCVPPASLYMQNVNAATLAQLMPNAGDTVILYDARDYQEYLIGKLADGNYWMLDNLALDPTTVSLATLQGKTNATNEELSYFKNGGGTTSDRYAITGVTNWVSTDSFSSPLVASSGLCYEWTCGEGKTWDKDSLVTSYGLGSGKRGVYYNYCAASAGSYCYGNNSSAGTSSGNATSDICPSGWRMPTGGDSGEYGTLISIYTNQTATDPNSLQYNLSLSLSGEYSDGYAYDEDAGGFFWTSTRYDNTAMYWFVGDGNSVVNTTSNRKGGYTIRCLFKI